MSYLATGGGVSMDASQDVWDWDWEVLPDHRSSSTSHGSKNLDDQEAEEHDLLPPSGDEVDVDVHDECKDIGVVPDETKPVVPNDVADDLMASDNGGEEEKKASSVVADLMDSDDGGEEGKTAFQSADAKDAADEGKFAQEEEEDTKNEEEEEEDKDDKAHPTQCVVFSVGKLKVNGIGALCSFGVAAASVCVFLIGGRLQHHQRHRQQEQQKIQLQFYGDDKRIQQVVQQTSRLNQAMSSVMGAGGASSTRANISFGGFYDGF